ncbi:unnamed protein product [Calypogeia fissa]
MHDGESVMPVVFNSLLICTVLLCCEHGCGHCWEFFLLLFRQERRASFFSTSTDTRAITGTRWDLDALFQFEYVTPLLWIAE